MTLVILLALFVAGAVSCYLVFMLVIKILKILAEVATVVIFHRASRKRLVGMEPRKVMGLNKGRMSILLYCAGVLFLLVSYTAAFVLIVSC